jgi:hypothetical protein
MFRIVWTSLITGATGHGEAIFTMQEALEIASASNKDWYSQIHHSIEKYESPALTLNVKGHRCSYGDLSFVGHATPTPTASHETTPIVSATPKPSASSASSAKEQSPPLR